ncbi:conserved hypothetical protein [Theileria equi strain WA]|uniref:Uncharacterized protein n=1 Tax=Theileria equi strain WA TaxID=1537102 RepID=L1LC02_THEEQ|nr:conserved hypothetical protein [Theileria equi strain WA]EKX72866.1 conserved hypothetical protein [Theileria equi strain WA]|eukprot:XP_004832318.1 conserved hypothetical protein [Theileria equi strain WA]
MSMLSSNDSKETDSQWLTTEQAHEISMMALQKGAAIERLVNVTRGNSVNIRAMKNAFFKLKAYTFGKDHPAVTSATEDPGVFKFSQDQLRLLRQEQLMLLSENERLVDELQTIRKLRYSGTQSTPNPTHISREPRESRLIKELNKTLSGEREVTIMRTRIIYFIAIVNKIKVRILGTCFRALNDHESFNRSKIQGTKRIVATSIRASAIILDRILGKKISNQLLLSLKVLRNPGIQNVDQM